MTSLEGSSKNVEKFFFFAMNFFHLCQKKKKKKQTNKRCGKKKVHGIFTHTMIANNLLLVANFLLLALINCKPSAFHVK
jgi:hypothetical protein